MVLVGVGSIIGIAEANASVRVCGPGNGHLVIARDVQAEVYRVHKYESAVYEYRGCVFGSKRSLRLGRELVSGSPYGSLAIKDMVLASAIVAYETELSSGAGELKKSERHVVVVDLRTGQVLHRVPTGMSRYPALKITGAGEVCAIVVKRNGAVAWINDTSQRENRFEVHALDANGERVLAVGSNVAPESLALAGSTVYWVEGGKPMSATLD